ncbi:DUF1801 domain-containing protein [Protaetiibacter mangrovi]|uniref:DUF1801 domain-containing protein n=1 Tax=Protaetiibacter mangrovi TaxID=2970926 RepID=A0ABT1ZD06_9MICO|nr:DUF1801 domain-containing protein [Protaetiibacter mangrovi]MCS0498577.1 DUF1801 domain-containing protein [Protaetiibacter mangrovi]
MTVESQIEAYLAGQPEPKRTELTQLHERIRGLMPDAELWFLDGTDASGKVVSNPNVGYGRQADRDFYRVGISANTSGISVYLMGFEDRTHLPRTIGDTIGKATVTGYCVKFRKLADIDLEVLDAAIRSVP